MGVWKDTSNNKLKFNQLPELSQPPHKHAQQLQDKEHKPQGWKQKQEDKPAAYTNWHTPLIWAEIVQAANSLSVGWKMSATVIQNVLHQLTNKDLAKISQTTIEGWIDCSGSRPKWSEKALTMAEKENHQGHSNGGWRRVLVCCRA